MFYLHFLLQLFSEKINGVEGTKHDEDFLEMERKMEVTHKGLADLQSRTTEYLQPNPASRAKLNMLNTVSKIRGQVKSTGYPQTEGLLGDCMIRHGYELGGDSAFGGALVDVGEAMQQMGDLKDSLDIKVKEKFIDPLQSLQDNELKEITHHLKKLEGRRLAFDYKKKRQGKIPDEEIRQALEKFEESKELAERSMFYFLENQVEQLSQLSGLVQAALAFHQQSSEVLRELSRKLQKRISTASSRPRREFKSKRNSVERLDGGHRGSLTRCSLKSSGSPAVLTVPGKPDHMTPAPLSWPESPPSKGGFQAEGEVPDQPCCRALYDFDPENAGELSFREGDTIILANQLDQNWYEGMINGDSGFFPVNYVEVIIPLPQ
ncbi:endophilin-A3 isoform X1 [Oryzias melastigma]|uniref:SH3-domain GRB2-like 3a n=1 Tax=Oryzias melastigma TaxID=30732 RepID=A0A3B3CSY7_ORYME|nr:endophilin-A3 isoform X1 [Oryzias melastigma]